MGGRARDARKIVAIAHGRKERSKQSRRVYGMRPTDNAQRPRHSWSGGADGRHRLLGVVRARPSSVERAVGDNGSARDCVCAPCTETGGVDGGGPPTTVWVVFGSGEDPERASVSIRDCVEKALGQTVRHEIFTYAAFNTCVPDDIKSRVRNWYSANVRTMLILQIRLPQSLASLAAATRDRDAAIRNFCTSVAACATRATDGQAVMMDECFNYLPVPERPSVVRYPPINPHVE